MLRSSPLCGAFLGAIYCLAFRSRAAQQPAVGDCTQWNATAASTIDCVALQRVEQRFGNGDHVYTIAEQTKALGAYFDAFFGAWRFHGAGRTVRVGLELAF